MIHARHAVTRLNWSLYSPSITVASHTEYRTAVVSISSPAVWVAPTDRQFLELAGLVTVSSPARVGGRDQGLVGCNGSAE